MKFLKINFIVILTLLTAACAGGSNAVLEPNTGNYRSTNVSLVYEGSTVGVPDESIADLKKYMEERFFGDKAIFTKGDDLTIKYGFITFDEGSRAARYFLGPIGGGEAKMVIRAIFIDKEGNQVAKIQSEGRLSGGFFGGGAGSAVKKAVKEIAEYAEGQFAQ